MMDQQNLENYTPASADPAGIALAKALGQWSKPAGSTRPSPKKTFDRGYPDLGRIPRQGAGPARSATRTN